MANVNTVTEGSNAKQIEVIPCKRELHVINPNVRKKSAIRKAKLRKQKLFAVGIMTFGVVLFLVNLATVGIIFLLMGVVGLASREVLEDE